MTARFITDHGTEGPAHDPYSWSELTYFRQDEKYMTLHVGLYVWVKTSQDKFQLPYVKAVVLFEQFMGISLKTAEKAVERRDNPKHCPDCGSKKREWAEGFPGETLLICGSCGRVHSIDFNESAIM